MAIQNRRGRYADFNPDKLLPAEWATVTSGDPHAKDGRAVYKCFAPGDVKRMATYEDMVENIDNITGEIQKNLITGVEVAIDNVNTAAKNADTATTTAHEAAAAAKQITEDTRALYEEIKSTQVGDLADIKLQIAEIIKVLSDTLGTI